MTEVNSSLNTVTLSKEAIIALMNKTLRKNDKFGFATFNTQGVVIQ